MCGITGAIAKTPRGEIKLDKIHEANSCLAKRGPDGEGLYRESAVALGHRRLSVIDTSEGGAQPMLDSSGRYVIIFNGEFFNYAAYREQLISKGITLCNHTDTEVVLQLYILHGADCLKYINGFFAFAIYDKISKTIFIARDRFGVKPLWIYEDDDNFLFSSELKSLMKYGIPKVIDNVSLYQYLQLNYTVAPHSILRDVKKMNKGSYILFNTTEKKTTPWLAQQTSYYELMGEKQTGFATFEESKRQLHGILADAVKRRLVADVPLGAFLSGGIDSSIICALASREVKNFHTFSIGFKDEKYFDETHYANIVAKKLNTAHTVFSLANDDLFHHLFGMLDYMDEPFADSSALAVYILSHETRKHVTVALSGDGADELFAGYNKHEAEWRIQQQTMANKLLRHTMPLLALLPQSRNNSITNTFRQVNRYARGLKMSHGERYYRWASLTSEDEARDMLFHSFDNNVYSKRKQAILKHFTAHPSINDVLRTDVDLVLENDMLVKVDSMSMANSLEIRNPFLDMNVVEFAFRLPEKYKINGSKRKIILKEAFKDDLPPEIFNRGKHGFEVPLLKWMRSELRSLIEDNLLSEAFVKEQNIFDYRSVYTLCQQLRSINPGEAASRIWALVVFQYWYKKNMM